MKNKLIKILSIFLVFNILLIPISSFAPGNQIKTVQAAEGLVDIRFFQAFISMIGITAAASLYMSQSFSIPEVDMVTMKDQFQATLDADATKKAAWMTAQGEYLAGGVAKTMGAVELAKIGVNDIYDQFKSYLKTKINVSSATGSLDLKTATNLPNTEVVNGHYLKTIGNVELYIVPGHISSYMSELGGESGLMNFRIFGEYIAGSNLYSATPFRFTSYSSPWSDIATIYFYDKVLKTWSMQNKLILNNQYKEYVVEYSYNQNSTTQLQYDQQKAIMATMGINMNISMSGITKNPVVFGNVTYNPTGDIVNSNTADTRSIIPTIPWIDTSVPVGTVVTPAISAPYAGAVPIDVPISVPIDPTDPVDPPVEEPTLIATVAAILAGITPISGILDNILDSELDIADVISVGLTDVVDGIGDIAGTLTGGITSSLTDIQSSISTLTAPASESINLDPVKNIPKVLFTKFPFSIPWDVYNVYNLMATDNRSPPEFSLGIPLSESNTLSTFGVSDLKMEIKLENYEEIAGIVRTAELLLFVLGLAFATKKLIWG